MASDDDGDDDDFWKMSNDDAAPEPKASAKQTICNICCILTRKY